MPSLLNLDDDDVLAVPRITPTTGNASANTDLLNIAPQLQIRSPDPDQPDIGQGAADIYSKVTDYIAQQQKIAQARVSR